MRLTDLKPYRSLLLYQLPRSGEAPSVGALLGETLAFVRGLGSRKRATASGPEAAGGLEVGTLQYVEERVPPWTVDDRLHDRLHHLCLIAAKYRLVAVLATDPRLKAKIARAAEKEGAFAPLARIPAGKINAAFVDGATRTLWLSGTHRRTTVKPDAKILSGLDLRDTIDPLADQSFYFSAARSISEKLRLPVGAAPRRSAIWAGASRSWEDFVSVLERLLDHLEHTTREEPQPFPALAALVDSARAVHGAFDVSLQPPELGDDPTLDQETREELERWAYGSEIRVDDAGPPIRTTVFLDGRRLGTAVLTPDWSDLRDVTCEATGDAAPGMGQLHRRALRHLRDSRWLKIRFDSGHTLSGGGLYEGHYQDREFAGFRYVDLDSWNVDREKPTPISETGNGQRSLFDWVVATWPNLDGSSALPGGWLACDDGSMETADFIHLTAEDPPVLTLIHVKGSGSKEAGRRISVSDYEVVTGQAVKNLRHLEARLLGKSLGKVHRKSIEKLVWQDRRPAERADFLARLAVLGANCRKRVVVLQPRVTEALVRAARGNPKSADFLRLRQLDTLLLGAEANCHGLGAELEVVTARA